MTLSAMKTVINDRIHVRKHTDADVSTTNPLVCLFFLPSVHILSSPSQVQTEAHL